MILKLKSTKHKSLYHPNPYTVIEKYGTQKAGVRGDKKKTCDAQMEEVGHVGEELQGGGKEVRLRTGA